MTTRYQFCLSQCSSPRQNRALLRLGHERSCLLPFQFGCMDGSQCRTRRTFARYPLAAQTPDAIPAKYAAISNRFIAAAQADSAGAWNRIAELTDRFGHRLSGSQARTGDQVDGRRHDQGWSRQRGTRAGKGAALGTRRRVADTRVTESGAGVAAIETVYVAYKAIDDVQRLRRHPWQ